MTREQAIRQGLLPPTCQADDPWVAGQAAEGADPCRACPADRRVCGGRPPAPPPPSVGPSRRELAAQAARELRDILLAGS